MDLLFFLLLYICWETIADLPLNCRTKTAEGEEKTVTTSSQCSPTRLLPQAVALADASPALLEQCSAQTVRDL
jgi:hypothetical protein